MGLRGPKLIFQSLIGYTILQIIQFLLIVIIGVNMDETFSSIFINVTFLLRLGLTAILWFFWLKIHRDYEVGYANVFIVFGVLFIAFHFIFSGISILTLIAGAIAFGFFYGGIEARNYS